MTLQYDDVSPGFVIQVISVAPESRIAAEGQKVPGMTGVVLTGMTDVTERVVSFEFEDVEKESDTLRLTVDNSDLYFLEHPAWIKGNIVRFFFGYPGRIFGPRLHVIDDFKGFLKMTITAVEESSLSNVAECRIFKNVRRVDIVRQLVAEGAFRGVTNTDIDETGLKDEQPREWQQSRQTDLQFLKRLAEDPGYEVFIEGDTLHFHPRRLNRRPARRFTYFFGEGDLLDFDIKSWKTSDRPGETDVMSRDPIQRENRSATGSNENTSRDVLGNQNSLVISRGRSGALKTSRMSGRTIDTSPDPSDQAVRQQADSRFRLQEQGEIEARAKIIGDPLLGAKQVIEIDGLSTQLSGKYYVERVVHKLSRGEGYVAELDLLKNAVTAMPSADPPSLDQAAANENTQEVPAERRKVIVRDPRTGALRQEQR